MLTDYTLRATPVAAQSYRNVPGLVWWGPAIALLVAILPLGYGYYTPLRVVVCAAATFLAWKEYVGNSQQANAYVWIFGGIALLYNPLLPIHLSKLIWTVINIITADIFLGHHKRCRSKA